MSNDNPKNPITAAVTSPAPSGLVVRSHVPQRANYREYRQELRYDFFYSCAYCTISEAEAQGIRLTIDHYEPRKARPDLENSYDNLMYACDQCNTLKGDRCPPPEAREAGWRFFRPDYDFYLDNFQKQGIRVEGTTNIGKYSVQALDLNRLSLRKLRGLRQRLAACDRLVSEGVLGLRSFHIDQLPNEVKGKAAKAIKDADSEAKVIVDEIDQLLRIFARSALLDPDPEIEKRDKERIASLRGTEALHPGAWAAPRKRRSK